MLSKVCRVACNTTMIQEIIYMLMIPMVYLGH